MLVFKSDTKKCVGDISVIKTADFLIYRTHLFMAFFSDLKAGGSGSKTPETPAIIR